MDPAAYTHEPGRILAYWVPAWLADLAHEPGRANGVPVDRPLLLTPEEAAVALRLGRTKLYELLRTKKIRSVREGASRRIAWVDLERYVEELRKSAA